MPTKNWSIVHSLRALLHPSVLGEHRGNKAMGSLAKGNRSLRIVLVVESAGGGCGRHVLELAEGLAERGHRVHVVYSPLRAEQAFIDELKRLRCIKRHAIPMRRAPHPCDLVSLLRLRSYAKQIGGADVLHGHSSKAGALVRLSRLVGLQGARIYTPHAFRTMDPTLSRPARLVLRIVERWLTRFGCDALIAVSPDERAHALGLGIPGNRVHVVLNAIPKMPAVSRESARARLGLGEDVVCVGFVGRFVHQKAPERMVDAIAPFAARVPRMRVVMVGEGPQEPLVRARIAEAGLEGQFILPGALPGSEVMPAFDVFVMPSRYEAMPYVLLEALAVGLPIVATDVGGVREVLNDGINGFIVQQSSLEELTAYLEYLIVNDERRRRMADAAARMRSAFDKNKMVRTVLDIYCRVPSVIRLVRQTAC